ncbi:MAG: DUF5011 domain-containing protein, partial [Nitrosopumilus sp.]|nr:DUF5011 domain-containing protein [Nitrosopumilus sp.]
KVPPVITIIGANNTAVLPSDGPYVDPGANCVDNADPDRVITGERSLGLTETRDPVEGLRTVTYRCTDSSGNQADPVVRHVIVLPADATQVQIRRIGYEMSNVRLGTPYIDAGAVCSHNGTMFAATPVEQDFAEVGTYQFELRCDAGGTTASVNRTVNVRGIDWLPRASDRVSIADGLQMWSELGSVPMPTVPDFGGVTCRTDANGMIDDIWIESDKGSGFTPGFDHTRTGVQDAQMRCSPEWPVRDGRNSDREDFRRLNMAGSPPAVDTHPPEIYRAGDLIVRVEQGSTYNDPGAACFDFSIPGGMDIRPDVPLDTSVPGHQLLTYTCSDGVEGTADATTERMVYVLEPGEDIGAAVIGERMIRYEQNSVPGGPGHYADEGARCLSQFSEGDLEGVDLVTTVTPEFDGSAAGTYVYTYACGAATSTRTVVVDDYTPPVLVVHGPLEQSIQKNDPWHDMGSTCTDVTDGVIDAKTAGEINPAVQGTYTRTYTCTDASGKSVSQNRTVTVSDSDAPAIYLRGLAFPKVSVGSVYEDPGAYCIDAIDGRSEAVRPVRPLDTSEVGEFDLVYTCTDDDGRSSTATRSVSVVTNAEPPEAFRRGGATTYHMAGTTYEDKGAYCIDATDGRFEAASRDVPTGLDTGRFRVSYTCTDSGGLTDTTSRAVNVVGSVAADTGRPAIMIRGGERVDHPIGTHYHDRGAICTDGVNGEIDVVEASGTVDPSVSDVYAITYACEDESGNEAPAATRTVIVRDVPVLEIRGGNRILAQNATYSDMGAICTSFEEEPRMVTMNPVDTAWPRNYTVTYECTVEGTFATSGANYTGTATGSRWVFVSDDTAPRMALRGGASVGVAAGGTYVEQGASCVDREEGHLPVYLRYVSPHLGSTPGVNTDAAYRYTATYTCADKSGNDASAERSISVGGGAPSGSAAPADG